MHTEKCNDGKSHWNADFLTVAVNIGSLSSDPGFPHSGKHFPHLMEEIIPPQFLDIFNYVVFWENPISTKYYRT